MNSPKDYLTDRVKAFRKKFAFTSTLDDGTKVTEPPTWQREFDELQQWQQISEMEAFLTETIEQSMEVGRVEGYRKGYQDGRWSAKLPVKPKK